MYVYLVFSKFELDRSILLIKVYHIIYCQPQRQKKFTRNPVYLIIRRFIIKIIVWYE